MLKKEEYRNKILVGDVQDILPLLPGGIFHTCVTSPPYYGLRDYGDSNQIGLEKTPEEYIEKLVQVFRGVKRVLRDDGTLWVNIGDSYSGSGKAGVNPEYRKRHTSFGKKMRKERFEVYMGTSQGTKSKDLMGIPWMLAFALRADGWYLRSEIIWHKTNPMPESIRDRPTKSHEQIFLLSKKPKYYYDKDAILEPLQPVRGGKQKKVLEGRREKVRNKRGEPKGIRAQNKEPSYNAKGRNKRSVWTISTKPFKEAHFAVFPPDLIEPCILAGSSENGCCSECGNLYKRILERAGTGPERKRRKHDQTNLNMLSGNSYMKWKQENPDQFLGWAPSCQCGAEEEPCLVLDPFFGAGTTGLVAARLGRDFTGIELKEDYSEMALARLNKLNKEFGNNGI